MFMPTKKKLQEEMMDQELVALKAAAMTLFTFGAKTQTPEYSIAAEAFNSSAIEKLGKGNCGFIALIK